jgi:hypothetical protein
MMSAIRNATMDAVKGTTARFVAALAAGLLLVGCHTPNRQVTSRAFLDRGTVPARENQVIWQSSALQRDSDITVTYRGAEGCPARLVTGRVSERTGRVSSKALQTDATGAEDVTVRLRGAQSVCLICGGSSKTNTPGECAYVIEQVNQSHGARIAETDVLPGVTLTNAMVSARSPAKVLWQTPIAAGDSSNRGCHVTLRIYGIGRFRAVLDYKLANGVRRQMAISEPRQLVSLVNVVKVSLSCAGAADSRCAAEVLQTDCPQ